MIPPPVSPYTHITRRTLARVRPDIPPLRRSRARPHAMERMADELERAAEADQSATVDLSTAAELSGFRSTPACRGPLAKRMQGPTRAGSRHFFLASARRVVHLAM